MYIPGRPPCAKAIPHIITQHGQTRIDPYFWLRNDDDQDVMRYLEAENAYTQQVMAHTTDFQEKLYHELHMRMCKADETVPVGDGDYWYYLRTEEHQQYPVFCRKHNGCDAPTEVLLDQNQLAYSHSYCNIGTVNVSSNHRWLAYTVDTGGNERYTLFIKDLTTGTLLPEYMSNVSISSEWAEDNHTLFYVVLDETLRPYKLLRHSLGTQVEEDDVIFHEADAAFFLNIAKTRSRAYLLLTLASTTTTEVWFTPAAQPDTSFTLIHARQPGLRYTVDHHSDQFLIVTNENAPNGKLVTTSIKTPDKEHWRELVPHQEAVLLEGIDVFRHHLVLYTREDGLKQICILDSNSAHALKVKFPEAAYTFQPGPNVEFDADTLRFTYSSPITPPSVIDYHIPTQTWEQKKQDEISGDYDPTHYVVARVMVATADGVHVPMTLVHNRIIGYDGRNPALLYGYGAYGISIEPGFSSYCLSLLKRGFVFAIAHVRGGSDLGHAWYDNGKLLNKKNTFTDFIACAEYLVATGYTTPKHLAIMGGSAGGLLIGAVVNMRPDLFQAAVAQSPFLDVVTTISDPSLPLTTMEYEEWGNPEDEEAFRYMLSYSPYDNIGAKKYPHLLLTTGLHDPRVPYWEAAKFVAKLRASKTDTNVLLLKTDMTTGHTGASGRLDYLKEVAFEYTFLLYALSGKEHCLLDSSNAV